MSRKNMVKDIEKLIIKHSSKALEKIKELSNQ